MASGLQEREPSCGRLDPKPASGPEHGRFIFLQPGGIVVADVPTRVKTILGSCVSFTVRAPRLSLAAVTHCLLPSSGCRLEMLSRTERLKYVDSAARILFETFTARGAGVDELEVKLVGGADSLSPNGAPHRYAVGGRNVEMALQVLADRGIVPVAAIVGGRTGRVLVFDTATGDIFVKRLPARLCSFPEES